MKYFEKGTILEIPKIHLEGIVKIEKKKQLIVVNKVNKFINSVNTIKIGNSINNQSVTKTLYLNVK